METIHIESPDCYRCKYNNRNNCKCECFEDAEKKFE